MQGHTAVVRNCGCRYAEVGVERMHSENKNSSLFQPFPTFPVSYSSYAGATYWCMCASSRSHAGSAGLEVKEHLSTPPDTYVTPTWYIYMYLMSTCHRKHHRHKVHSLFSRFAFDAFCDTSIVIARGQKTSTVCTRV